MRWRTGAHQAQIVSDAGYTILKRDPDCFLAWGPRGSQDVSWIKPLGAKKNAGRQLLGVYCSPEEARAACEKDATASADADEQLTFF